MRHQVRMPQLPPSGGEQLAADRLVAGDAHPAQVGQDRRRGVLGRDARLALEQVRVDLAVALAVVVAADRRARGVEQDAASVGAVDDRHAAHRKRRGRS